MIIFLYGPDTYRSRQKLKKLKEKFIREKDKSGLGITELDGQQIGLDEFRSRVYSPGFFSNRRMIIIKNLLAQTKDEELLEEILEYLKKARTDQDNITAFIEDGIPAANKSLKGKIFSLLKKEKYAQSFPLLKSYQLNQWIKKEVEKKGAKISPAAQRKLAAFVGTDLWRLASEIEKLVSFCQRRLIKRADVALLVRANLDENIFHLTDAVGTKNRKLALKLLGDQIASGIEPGRLLGMIARQFRIILQTKTGQASAGLHPYVVRLAQTQAKNFETNQLKNIYQRLLEIDVKIKTTNIDLETLLDLLIARGCNQLI